MLAAIIRWVLSILEIRRTARHLRAHMKEHLDA